MNKIYFFLLLLSGNIALGQSDFVIRQVLEQNTGMGYRMAVHDNTMFLGQAHGDNVNIYIRQADGTWTFQQTLKPSDKSSDVTTIWRFGFCMAFNDSSAVITAVSKDLIRKDAGGVYFFRKALNGIWEEEFIVENPTQFSFYGGQNVAINKNKVTVSHNNGSARFVHIFERNDNGTWAISDTILESNFGINGMKVFFDDSTFIAMLYSLNNQRVKEFKLQPNGDWITGQILGTGVYNYGTYFGANLSVDNHQMAVGAASFRVMDEQSGSEIINAGKVFVYERLNNEWVLQQELISPAAQEGQRFGNDILIKRDMLFITSTGAKNLSGNTTGAIYIYRKVNATWTLAQTYFPENYTTRVGDNIFYENDQIISYGHNSVSILEVQKDCQGVTGGSAELNSCDICYGGTTGLDSLQSEELCIISSFQAISPTSRVSVSPNPFDRQIYIQASDNARLVLTDCYGRVLAQPVSNGLLDTDHLSAGMYFLIAEHEGEKHIIKIFRR